MQCAANLKTVLILSATALFTCLGFGKEWILFRLYLYNGGKRRSCTKGSSQYRVGNEWNAQNNKSYITNWVLDSSYSTNCLDLRDAWHTFTVTWERSLKLRLRKLSLNNFLVKLWTAEYWEFAYHRIIISGSWVESIDNIFTGKFPRNLLL